MVRKTVMTPVPTEWGFGGVCSNPPLGSVGPFAAQMFSSMTPRRRWNWDSVIRIVISEMSPDICRRVSEEAGGRGREYISQKYHKDDLVISATCWL
jgi:hypothetical protein